MGVFNQGYIVSTAAIVRDELVGLAGFIVFWTIAGSNVLFLATVACSYLGWRVLYLRSRFKNIIVKTEENTKASVWDDVMTTCHSDLIHPERDE